MKNALKHIVIWNEQKKAYDVREDFLDEEDIPYTKEKDLIWIHFNSNVALIPLTKKGVEILEISYNCINDLLYYEEKIIDELEEFIDDKVIPKTSIDNFKEIVRTYDKLNISCLKREDILILSNIENYKFKTRLEVASSTSIEVLIRLLSQNISITDIKKLKDSSYFTPIIFPIKAYPEIDFRSRRSIQKNFYKDEINLMELLTTGHLKLNTHEED